MALGTIVKQTVKNDKFLLFFKHSRGSNFENQNIVLMWAIFLRT